ncbi:hypothetical protein ACLOJK_018663 [Asimina triloba]
MPASLNATKKREVGPPTPLTSLPSSLVACGLCDGPSQKAQVVAPMSGPSTNAGDWSSKTRGGLITLDDYNAGLSLYGDKAKPKVFAARFASPDGSEVVSVVIRPTNQLKITFLEAKDIADLGSLKEAVKIFVPGGGTLYSARTIEIKEDEGFRTYYYYEFGVDDQHVALVAAVNSGKAYIAGATAPQSKWEDDGIKLRSAAISMSVL